MWMHWRLPLGEAGELGDLAGQGMSRMRRSLDQLDGAIFLRQLQFSLSNMQAVDATGQVYVAKLVIFKPLAELKYFTGILSMFWKKRELRRVARQLQDEWLRTIRDEHARQLLLEAVHS